MLAVRRLLTRRVLEDRLPQQRVGSRIEENAVRFEPVAPCAPGLLLIVLDGFRHGGVNDAADIATIDPHPEGNGGANDRSLVIDEVLLHLYPFLVFQPRVVGIGRKACSREFCCQFFSVLAAQAVNDPAFGLVFPKKGNDLFKLLRALSHLEAQVLAVEGSHVLLGIRNVELMTDILPGGLIGSGGKGNYRNSWKLLLKFAR